jgi:hypothetical protein
VVSRRFAQSGQKLRGATVSSGGNNTSANNCQVIAPTRGSTQTASAEGRATMVNTLKRTRLDPGPVVSTPTSGGTLQRLSALVLIVALLAAVGSH